MMSAGFEATSIISRSLKVYRLINSLLRVVNLMMLCAEQQQ